MDKSSKLIPSKVSGIQKMYSDNLRYATCVYQILNTVNGKAYLGSTKRADLRFNKHSCALMNSTHPNRYLQSAYNKYGASSFQFSVIYVHERLNNETDEVYYSRLLDIENKLILEGKYNDKRFGYNQRITAKSNRGITHSDAAKTRMRGRKLSEQTRLRMSESRQGELHHASVINDAIAKEIKILIAKGWRNMNIAAHFGVKKSIINDIKNGGAWNNAVFTQDEFNAYVEPITKGKTLNSKDVLIIKYLFHIGLCNNIIEKYLGIKNKVKDIRSGKCNANIALDSSNTESIKQLIDFDKIDAIKNDYQREVCQNRKLASKKGEASIMAKMTEKQVIEIARLLRENTPCTAIANKLNVGVHGVYKIKSGDNWSHITGFIKK